MTDTDWDDYGWDDYGDGEDANCQTCGGDGVTECDDPIQCSARHFEGGWETCPNCRGSGLAKDQCYW